MKYLIIILLFVGCRKMNIESQPNIEEQLEYLSKCNPTTEGHFWDNNISVGKKPDFFCDKCSKGMSKKMFDLMYKDCIWREGGSCGISIAGEAMKGISFESGDIDDEWDKEWKEEHVYFDGWVDTTGYQYKLLSFDINTLLFANTLKQLKEFK